MILLDTCTLLWLVSDQKKLSEHAIQIIRESIGTIFVSAITAFEIGVKCGKGLLKLPSPPSVWFEEALELHGLVEIPVSSRIALLSCELPAIHKDPVDRMLISTAIEHRLRLITPDTVIDQYPQHVAEW